MAQQWLRKASLIIGANSDLLDVSALQFKFQTTAHTIASPGTLQLRLFNPAPATIKKIIDEGSQIFLNAGYEGAFGQIFSGAIIQLRSGRENGTDTYLDISATDGDHIYNQALINISIAAGTTKLQRLGSLATAGQFQLETTVQDDGAKLPRGKAYFGLARDHLRPLCATLGADWNIREGKVQVLAQNEYLPGAQFILTAATGLIGLPTQNMEGINIKCLLNPAIIPGGKVQIDNAAIQQYQIDLGYTSAAQYPLIPPLNRDGNYKVLYLTHTGDTRGQEWYTDMITIGGEHMINPNQTSKYIPF